MADLLEHLAHPDLLALLQGVRSLCVSLALNLHVLADVHPREVLQVLVLVLQFCGEGAEAHARSVGLHHTNDAVDDLRRHPEPSAHPAHSRVRRRDKRICAEVNVQQGRVGTLHQYPAAAHDVLMNESDRVDDLLPQQLSEIAVPLHLLIHTGHATLCAIHRVERLLRVVLAQALAQQCLRLRVRIAGLAVALLRPPDELSQPLLKFLKVEEVTKAQAIPDGLRRIARADATLGGADRVAGCLHLEDAINDLMAVDQDVRACGDEHPLKRTWVKVFQRVQLFHHCRQVACNAVADEILAALVDDPAGEQVERVLLTVDNKRVACVGSAVKASAELHVLRQNVDQLALALVAPLRPEHHAEAPRLVVRAIGRGHHVAAVPSPCRRPATDVAGLAPSSDRVAGAPLRLEIRSHPATMR
mmetsp:Transcript_4789/g.12296  ORF Transcript_4789/g.12296 Transcript_4789/m.12296 type:complete len:416 (+) Transcript_4789:506-1753(+)